MGRRCPAELNPRAEKCFGPELETYRTLFGFRVFGVPGLRALGFGAKALVRGFVGHLGFCKLGF